MSHESYIDFPIVRLCHILIFKLNFSYTHIPIPQKHFISLRGTMKASLRTALKKIISLTACLTLVLQNRPPRNNGTLYKCASEFRTWIFIHTKDLTLKSTKPLKKQPISKSRYQLQKFMNQEYDSRF